MQGGGDEPFYSPAKGSGEPSILHYRSDFVASLLHEVAHWCLAGAQRRRLPDFGYSYQAPPRSREQQVNFLSFEVKPQALEWIFSDAAGLPFELSLDDFSLEFHKETLNFRQAVFEQKQRFLNTQLPKRASIFKKALERANI